MRLAVCEGCCADMERLVILLKKYCSQRSEPLKLSCYFNLKQLISDVGSVAFDVVFLGVCAEEKELAAALRRAGYSGRLVIMSESAELAVLGYGVGACGFLMKPVSSKALETLFSGMETIGARKILLRCAGGISSLSPDNITYIESGHNCCTVHTVSGGSVTVKMTLSHMSEMLGNCFLRCHRSFIVNMKQIAEADGDFFLYSGERVLVRKRERCGVMEAYESFLSRQLKRPV